MSVLKAAGIIAILSLFSKFVGLFREMVISNYFGTTYIRDAYGIAQLLPASFALVMLAGLNGPFHSSVVTVISKYKARGEEKDLKVIITTLIIISCIFMGIVSLLCYQFAPYIVELISKQSSTETKLLAVSQLRIMCPMFVISALIGISYGILNIEKIYFTSSLSPIMASLAVIGSLFATSSGDMSMALAWGTMIGAVFQLLLQIVPMTKIMNNYIGSKIQFNHPGIKQIMAMLAPASLSSTVGQVNLIIMTYFASGLPNGTISAINASNFIYQLPLGIMLTALLVPMLPILSQTATYNDNLTAFKRNLNKSLRSVSFLSIPAMVIFLCSGKQFIQVLFERGEFNSYSTQITYNCLKGLCLSLVFYAIRDLLVRVFYALDSAKTPFYTSVFSIITTTFACWLFVYQFQLQEFGITLATSFVTLFNMSVLLVVLRKRIGKWLEAESIKHILKVCVTSIPVGIFCIGFNYAVNSYFTIPIFIVYSILLGILGIICVGILRTLKDQETIDITDKFINKAKRLVKRA